jgi:hypothetical protein
VKEANKILKEICFIFKKIKDEICDTLTRPLLTKELKKKRKVSPNE